MIDWCFIECIQEEVSNLRDIAFTDILYQKAFGGEKYKITSYQTNRRYRNQIGDRLVDWVLLWCGGSFFVDSSTLVTLS